MYINWEVTYDRFLGVMTKLLLQRAIAGFFRNLDGPQAHICACQRTEWMKCNEIDGVGDCV